MPQATPALQDINQIYQNQGGEAHDTGNSSLNPSPVIPEQSEDCSFLPESPWEINPRF